jgi:hypothetical protein
MKKIFTLCFVSLFSYTPSWSQDENVIAKFLSAGQADASKLIGAYFSPAIKSASYGMAAGWVNTAKAHKPFGIDIGLSINTAFIPKSEDYFDPAKLGLSPTTVFTSSASNGLAPTFMGPDESTSYTFLGDLDNNPNTAPQTATISGPEGLNIKEVVSVAAVPIPVLQIGIGLVKNTDLKVRLVPTLNVGGSSIKMFGVGVMHDIKQHIPGVKNLPFDLSVLVNYNSFTGESDLTNTNTTDGVPDSDDGIGIYKFNSFGGQVLISKKLAVLTVYGGAGYTAIKTNVAFNGTYTVQAAPVSFDITNPVDIDIKNNSPFFLAGARLKFGPFFLNGNYTFQKFNTLSVGFGFAFR